MRKVARLGSLTGPAARRRALAVAAAAVAAAALAGSAAPGATTARSAAADRGGGGPQPSQPARPFDDTQPPSAGPGPDAGPSPSPSRSAKSEPPGELDGSGIPVTVLAAYKKAAKGADAGCHLPWQLLAGIGKVESGHARGGRLDSGGTAVPRIVGPVLDGGGFAEVRDTDGGRYDGDRDYDRAVGPMQFLPGTWAKWGADGDGDGVRDPENIWDATRGAADYLCAGGKDLAVSADLDRAVLSYNNSREYLRTVTGWMAFYLTGAHGVPDVPGGSPSGGGGVGPEPLPGLLDPGGGAGAGGPGREADGGGRGGPRAPGGGSRPPAVPGPTGATGSVAPGPSRPGKDSTGSVRPTPTPTPSCPTPSGSPVPTPSGSPSPSVSPSPSGSPEPTCPTPSGPASPSPSATPSKGAAGHPKGTERHRTHRSEGTAGSPSPSASADGRCAPEDGSPSPSGSPGPSTSPSPSASPTPSPSPSPSGSGTPAPSGSPSASPSASGGGCR